MATKIADHLAYIWAKCRTHLSLYSEIVHSWPALAHHYRWQQSLHKPKLVIVAPPASAKSSHIGVSYTAHRIGNDPTMHVGYVTHSDSLSVTRSLAVRDTVEFNDFYHQVFPEAKPNKGRGWAQETWYLERPDLSDPSPTFAARGLLGSILGLRFDLLVIDDICTQENTQTQLQRDKSWDWLNHTLLTRMSPEGQVVVIGTRWHHDDVPGRLIDGGWPVLHTLALDDENKSYWPEYWPTEKLLAIRDGYTDEDGHFIVGIGTRAFEGQYQGRPTAEMGNILKWFPTYSQLPPLKYKLHRWDTAWGETQTADFSAMVALGLGEDNNLYVLSGWQDRLDTPEVALAVKALAEREHPNIIVLEEAARAKEVVKAVKRATMLPITTEPVPARMDKTARANAAAPTFESGRVLFPARYHANYGPWVEELIEQCKRFPLTGHFDMADALIGGVLRLVGRPTGRPHTVKARWSV